MSSEKEYIVTLKNPNDWNQFHDEMIKNISHNFIPNRSVHCTNDRPFSETQSHYMLSESEATNLLNDPRVLYVELDPDKDPTIEIRTTAQRYQTFDNSSNNVTYGMTNWGLLRSTSVSNPFATTSSVTANFNYNLTGKGVDIVVIDTGIAEHHPEFAVNVNGTGGSRVQDYDWTRLGVTGITALTGGSGINGFLGDCDGHGSNCASIAAGNTCGWAKDSAIYSIRAIGSDTGSNTDIVTGKTLGLISSSLVFDLVKAFHLSKPILSNGYRRPTICTNSWQYSKTYQNMQQTSWRGTIYSTTSTNSNYGEVSSSHGVRVNSVDVAMASAMSAGVIIIGAAGNSSHKCDIVGGIDYNNYWTDGSSIYYYHRGSTPGSGVAADTNNITWYSICVGALDNFSTERKASFSETGPRVDVYGPGVSIMGAYANRAVLGLNSVADPRLSGYYLNKISGTSQATPQVAGILACAAQVRPWMNQSMARSWISEHGLLNVLNEYTSSGTGYTNGYYLQGGTNSIIYMPFNSNQSITITGGVHVGAPIGAL